MGNQLSKRKKFVDSKSASTSTKYTSDSFNNGSALSSCVPKYAQEVFPHTTSEAGRQQGEHYLLKHVFQTSHFAPVNETLTREDSKVLDIGCGVHASWLLDMANDFPNCKFIGIDIIQPFSLETDTDSIGHIPANCQLVKLDLFEGFSYPDKSFDFVHQRMMQIVYPGDKVSWMFAEMLRLTKDNGWIELVELDSAPKRAGPIFAKVFVALRALLVDRLGRPLTGSSIPKKMEQNGFLDITTDYGSAPVCWGGYVGKLVYEVCQDLLIFFKHLGPSIYGYLDLGSEFNEEAYDALLDSAFDECVEYQTFLNIRWVYGRKPASS